MTWRRITGHLAALALLSSVAAAAPDLAWPRWRGPAATGAAATGNPPTTWSESRNVRWKVPLPGKGHSTPVVWGDRVFVTAAIPHGEAKPPPEHDHDHGAHDNLVPLRQQRFVVLALDLSSGKLLWQRTVRDEQPHEGTHTTGSWASPSPLTDGTRVYASFGSRGIYALTLDGEPVWERDLGDMKSRHGHGEGSSPALHDNTLVVNWDHQGSSFLVALDASTGKTRWKVARDEITSWSTPLIVKPGEHGKQTQVVISATNRVRGYDLADGSVIWELGGLSRNVVASPVAADGLVYVGNSYDWQAMMGVDLARAKGDITGGEAVIWKRERDTPYVPSPVLHRGSLCFIKHNQAFLTCLEARTGKTRFGPVRMPGLQNIFSSPVAVQDRLYVPSRNGVTAVVRAFGEGPPELIARNRLDDAFSASPVIVGDLLLLRGEEFLYAIGAAGETTGSNGP